MTQYHRRYTSGDLLASGSLSKIFQCTRKKDKKSLCVKVIKKRHLNERSFQSIHQEARILFSFNFPHILSVIDVYQSENKIKIILPFCSNGDLAHHITSSKKPVGRLSETKSAKIMCILALTLKHIHSRLIVHRNLRLDNILFTKDGILKLTGFRFARCFQLDSKSFKMKTCCGSPLYGTCLCVSQSKQKNETCQIRT